MSETSSVPVVLVVDDNVTNLMLFKGMLNRLGCDAITLDNGAEVTEATRRHQPGVILMDFYMQGISGLDAVRSLKAAPDTCDVPVYALTAMDPKKLAEIDGSSLFSGVLRKPPSVSQLRAVLQRGGVLPVSAQ